MIAKYYTQVKQQSLDGGLTWVDVSPMETRTSPIAYPNDVDCGGEMDYTSVGMVFLTITDGIGWIGASTLDDGVTIDYALLNIYYNIMKNAKINSGVTYLTYGSFNNVPYLEEIELPQTLERIGDNCFRACPLIEELIIPQNVTYIGSGCFVNCNKLKRIFMQPITPPTLSSTTLDSNIMIYVLDASWSAYKSAWDIDDSQIRPISELLDGAKTCKYKIQRKQESYDNVHWVNLNEYSEGDFIESGSSDCSSEQIYRWKDVSGYTCDEFASCVPYKAVIDYKRIPAIPSINLIGTSPYETICPNGSDTLTSSEILPYLRGGSWNGTSYDSYLTILEIGSATTVVALKTEGTHSNYENRLLSQELTSVTFSDTVRKIDEGSFANATKLSSVTFNQGLEEIWSGAFNGCTSFSSVTLPSSVNYINNVFGGVALNAIFEGTTPPTMMGGINMFQRYFVPCEALDDYRNEPDFANYRNLFGYDYPYLFGYGGECGDIQELDTFTLNATYSDGLQRNMMGITNVLYDSDIGAFFNNGRSAVDLESVSGVTQIKVGTCVDALSTGAFATEFTGVTDVVLSPSIKRIRQHCFFGMVSLENITVMSPTPPDIYFEREVFGDTNDTFKIFVPRGSVNLYKTTQNFYGDGWASFADRIYPMPIDGKYLIECSDGSTHTAECDSSSALTRNDIAQYSSITRCDVGDCVTSIENGCFSGCTSLSSVTMTDNVTTLGANAFNGCSSLVEFEIPTTVSSIGNNCFSGCTSLSAITCQSSTPPTIGSNVFADTNNAPIWVHSGDVATYKSAWSEYESRIKSIEVTDYGKFYVEYSDSTHYTTECDSATTLTKSDLISGSGAYTSITLCQIGDCITSIDSSAFADCSNMETIGIPSTITTIGNYAFNGCTSLTSVTIPDSVTSIGSEVFKDCNSLESAVIGSGMTNINHYTFLRCRALSSVTLPDTLTTIGTQCFDNCNSLGSITIPDSVTELGYNAFKSAGLTSITIGSGCTTIQGGCFSGCPLTSITIYAPTPPTLGYNALATSETFTVYVPQENLSTYQSAWGGYDVQAIPT